jgi:peroxiredoxin
MRFGFLTAALLALAFLTQAEDKPVPGEKPKAEKKSPKEKDPKDAGETEKKGTKAPDFTLLDLAGKKHSLKDFKGKTVVLEWCNYGCPFVKKHYKNGDMQALQKAYTAKGVVWLAIMSTNPKHKDYREPAALKEMNKERKAVPTAMLMDADGTVGRAYKAKTTPTMVVIDKDGYIAYHGAIDSVRSADPADIKEAKNYVREALDAMLAGKPVPVAQTTSYG